MIYKFLITLEFNTFLFWQPFGGRVMGKR